MQLEAGAPARVEPAADAVPVAGIGALVARAHAAGVGLMVTICTRIRNLDKLLAISAAHPTVYCSVGTHPHYADEELDISTEQIIELAQHPRVVAIGEASH